MALFRSEPSWQRDPGVKTNTVGLDPLSVIYNEGQWKSSYVSPMYNLLYDAVKLKQYAAKIRHSIVAAVNSSSKYLVKVEKEPQLKFSENDAHGLVITVSSTNEGNSKTKVCYVAVLLSWGTSTTLQDSVHLPYMLERGEQKIGVAVKSTLQMLFDCNIKQFSFTQHHLLMFGFSFLEYDMSRQMDNIGFVYKTPQMDHKDKLTLAFQMEDARTILNRAKEEAANPSDAPNVAYQLLQEQIYHMFNLDVPVFYLSEVILPKAEVKSNGIVKMKTPELVKEFFTVLNYISAD